MALLHLFKGQLSANLIRVSSCVCVGVVALAICLSPAVIALSGSKSNAEAGQNEPAECLNTLDRLLVSSGGFLESPGRFVCSIRRKTFRL